MGARVLTTASAIQCAHGAPAVLAGTDARVSAGARVLRTDDTHQVVACPHTTSAGNSPCASIEWAEGARRVKVGGVAPLVETSIGTCKTAAGVVQGVAVIAATQPRTAAT